MVDEAGNVLLLEPLRLNSAHRALVIILDDPESPPIPDTALASEPALAADWNRSEEDLTWSHLQPVS